MAQHAGTGCTEGAGEYEMDGYDPQPMCESAAHGICEGVADGAEGLESCEPEVMGEAAMTGIDSAAEGLENLDAGPIHDAGQEGLQDGMAGASEEQWGQEGGEAGDPGIADFQGEASSEVPGGGDPFQTVPQDESAAMDGSGAGLDDATDLLDQSAQGPDVAAMENMGDVEGSGGHDSQDEHQQDSGDLV
jgi:hypothetical protein